MPPAIAGPIIRPRLNDAELRATALVSVSRPTISLTNACRAGVSNAAAVPKTKAMHVDVPRLGDAGDGEDAEHRGGRRHDDLRHHHHRALGEAIGDHAGDRREQQDRQELQPGRQAEGAGAAGEGEHEPVLGDALHPRARCWRPASRRRTAGSCGSAARRTWTSRFAGHAVEKWRDRAQQVDVRRVEVGEVQGQPGVAAPAVLVEHCPGLSVRPTTTWRPSVSWAARVTRPASWRQLTVRVIDGGLTFSIAASSPMVRLPYGRACRARRAG